MIIVCACVCALIIAESQETSDAKCDPTTGLKVHSAKYVYAFIAYIRFRRGYDTIRYLGYKADFKLPNTKIH